MDHTDWNERYSTDDYVWDVEPNRFLAEEVADLTPGRALDLACGEGRNSVWLAEQGWAVTGVDFSDVGLEKGRRLAEHRGVAVDWVHADVTTHDAPPGHYELVIIFYLQLPPEERQATLLRAAAAVAPGGTFLLVAHDLSNLDGGYGGPQSPTVLTDPEGIAAHLAELSVERAEVVERPVDVDGETRVALDTFVRAHRPT